MGELVDLAAYKKQKEEQEKIAEEKRQQAELDATIEEMEMLKRILSDIMEDLPKVETSILYVPIEPKLDAFMSKDIDGYLDTLGLKLDEDQRPLFPGRDLDIEGFKDWKRSAGIPTSTPEIDDAFRKLEDIDENNNDETDET